MKQRRKKIDKLEYILRRGGEEEERIKLLSVRDKFGNLQQLTYIKIVHHFLNLGFLWPLQVVKVSNSTFVQHSSKEIMIYLERFRK